MRRKPVPTITPLHKRIVVERITKVTRSLKAHEGLVQSVAVAASEYGLRAGQTVLFERHAGVEATVDGVSVLLLTADEVLAVVERNGNKK